ncbi:hypothetical protein DXT99_17935 [Pontibacter diazotrophicus]|uniref:Uncharacterized protein n=1 Tax=Pontibacter diazotrophicus TaxID=1400979 RepID=A0A3D8L8C6_9BACT|nr:hypothetical protein DXT99_17935 [Pontibacter diazotrophicus]
MIRYFSFATCVEAANTALRLVAVSMQADETGVDLTKQANLRLPAQKFHVFRDIILPDLSKRC